MFASDKVKVQEKTIGLWEVFGLLCSIASVGSVLMLVKQGLDIGFVGPFKLVLEEYEFWTHAFFGWWADPAIRLALLHVRDWIGLDLHLSPEWKHIFLILCVYFGASARVERSDRRWLSVLFTVLWGGFIATIGSVAFGSVLLGDPTSGVLACIVPVTAVVFYELGRRIWNATYFRPAGENWRENFLMGARIYVVPVALIGGFSLIVAVVLKAVSGTIVNPGLTAFFGFIILLGLRWVSRGLRRAINDRRIGESWAKRYYRSRSGRMGLYMFGVIGGVVAFLLANAGVKLLNQL
jgi:hypothetical protein